MRKFFVKLGMFLDHVKDIIIWLLVMLLILLVVLVLGHNIAKMLQISQKYEGDDKQTYDLPNGDIVNCVTFGEGDQTIVILSDYGVQAPVIFYKNLAKRLQETARVVILEYPGYGYAPNTEKERTNENIAEDVKQALEQQKIAGPYVFVLHGTSNLYGMKFAQMYPEEVKSVILLDAIYPEMVTKEAGLQEVNRMVTETKRNTILEYTGLIRLLTYLKPDQFALDYMQKDENLTETDRKQYRQMIATHYRTKTMQNEAQNFEKNMKELKNSKYPEHLPLLQMLASETQEKYDEMYATNGFKQLAQNQITSEQIQKIVEIKGKHALHLSNPEEVAEAIQEFLEPQDEQFVEE